MKGPSVEEKLEAEIRAAAQISKEEWDASGLQFRTNLPCSFCQEPTSIVANKRGDDTARCRICYGCARQRLTQRGETWEIKRSQGGCIAFGLSEEDKTVLALTET